MTLLQSPGMRILVLDDHVAQAHMLALSLRAEGFLAVTFTCPHEALKNIREADVLVTDYHLPGMTGLEVARRAYAQGWRGSLFITSGHFAAVAERIEHPLLHGILEKPFSILKLVEKLRDPA